MESHVVANLSCGSAGACLLTGPSQRSGIGGIDNLLCETETVSGQHRLHLEWMGSADWWRACCAGVLTRQEGKGHWAALKRAFRLLVDDVDDQDPADPAYVFSGHCPLTVSPPPGPPELPGQHVIGQPLRKYTVQPLKMIARSAKPHLSETAALSSNAGAMHAGVQHAH